MSACRLARLGQHFLGPRHLLGTRPACGDQRLAVACGQRQPVRVLDLGQGRLDLRGQVVGHEPHLLVRFLGRPGLEEIDVVHVAAGAVGHHGHHGRILLVALQQTLQTLAVHAVVVGRNVTVSHAAHVVQRIAGVHGDRPAIGLAHGEDRHHRIGRPGRLHQVRAARRLDSSSPGRCRRRDWAAWCRA